MEVCCEKFMLVHSTLFCYIIHKLYMGLWKAVCIMVAGLPVQCSDSLWCCVRAGTRSLSGSVDFSRLSVSRHCAFVLDHSAVALHQCYYFFSL